MSSAKKPGADSVAVVGELLSAGYQEAPYFLKGCSFLALPEDEESETGLVLVVGLNDSQKQRLQNNAERRKTVLLADEKIGIGLPPELRENGLLPRLQSGATQILPRTEPILINSVYKRKASCLK